MFFCVKTSEVCASSLVPTPTYLRCAGVLTSGCDNLSDPCQFAKQVVGGRQRCQRWSVGHFVYEDASERTL